MNDKNKTKKELTDQTVVFGLELGVNIDKRVMRVASMFILELVVLLVAGYFLVVPRITEINRLNNNLELQETQLNNMNRKLDVLTEFEGNQARYDTVLKAALPVTKDVGLVLASLRQLAQEAQIEIISYSVDPVIVDEERQAVAFGAQVARTTTRTENFRMDLTIAGQSSQVQRFLELVNTSLPLKVVEDMVITQGNVQEASGILEMRVEIRNYFLPLTQKANPSGLLRILNEKESALLEEMIGFRTLPLSSEGTTTDGVPLGNQNLFGL